MMKIYVLTDNHASGMCLAEHGLSYLIESDKKILFDTGHTDLFLKNAERMGIDLDVIDTVVLSHGHWDHGNGLKFLKNKKLICHPEAFIKRFNKNKTKNIGLELSYEKLLDRFELVVTKESYQISENIFFLGEIPRLNNFESKTTTFVDENQKNDFLPDDSGLAIILGDEIVVVSGCAHSGICNIIEHGKKVTGINKVKAVIGGFHLKDDGFQTKETIKYFKDQNIEQIFPSHCTELPALSCFFNSFKIKQVKTGFIIDL